MEPPQITSAKIDIAGLQHTLFVGLPPAGPASASVSSKDSCDLQDAHLVRRARQIRPRRWPLTVLQTGRAASLDATCREIKPLQSMPNHVTARSASGRRLSSTPRSRSRITPASTESCLQQGCNEVAILLPERTELGNTEIFLVQAPTGELRLFRRRRRVGVLHFNQLIAPPIRERRRFQIDAVDAETVQFLECGELARDALDQVSKTRRLITLLSAIGRMSTSTDMVASAGSASSRKVPRIACEPTTITSVAR